MKPYIIGMDIGGTNVRIAMGCREESPRHFRKIPRQTVLPGEAPAKRLGEFIREYCRRNGEERLPQAVVIGFPATLDRARHRVVQAPNIPGLDELSAEELERELDVPVYLEKDVNLLFACDREDLGIPDRGLSVGVYVGTGIGNAIYYNGYPICPFGEGPAYRQNAGGPSGSAAVRPGWRSIPVRRWKRLNAFCRWWITF